MYTIIAIRRIYLANCVISADAGLARWRYVLFAFLTFFCGIFFFSFILRYLEDTYKMHISVFIRSFLRKIYFCIFLILGFLKLRSTKLSPFTLLRRLNCNDYKLYSDKMCYFRQFCIFVRMQGVTQSWLWGYTAKNATY